jgi:rod shape-determining protein MreC
MLAEAALNRYTAVQEQNQRLQRLLDVQRSLGLGAQLARLIDVDPGPFHRRIVLILCSADGVKVNQAVIDGTGVMGQIVESCRHEHGLLITNGHAIPVAVERTGLRVMRRQQCRYARIAEHPISADVKIGDRLITSGLGGIYPAGFPVGEFARSPTTSAACSPRRWPAERGARPQRRRLVLRSAGRDQTPDPRRRMVRRVACWRARRHEGGKAVIA